MKIVSDLSLYNEKQNTSIALGTFDGVHIGHADVIRAAAECQGATPAVFTFSRSPAGIIKGSVVGALTTATIKKELVESMGIEMFISPDFMSVREMTAIQFIKMLKERFNAVRLCCGFNFRFGANSAGDAALLRSAAKELGIEVKISTPVMSGGEPVSSSRIRSAIENGNIVEAEKMLGHGFAFDFEVIDGDKRGRLLNFPTINQRIPQTFVQPRHGVYSSKSLVDGVWRKSVTNIGIRPTVGSDFVGAETNILNFDGNLYGEKIKVELCSFLRGERRFSDVDELRLAIANDVQTVRNMEY